MSEETVIKAEVGKQVERPTLLAVILIAVGLVLLTTNLLDIDLMDYLWPGFIVGSGLTMLWPVYHSTPESRSRLSFLAVPGAMAVALGGLLFLMNLTNHFESMAYSWTLVLAAGAAGYGYMKRFEESGRVQEKVHKFIRVMVLAFMGLAAFFELLILQSLGGWWPVLLIGLGIYLYVKNARGVEND